MTAQSQPWPDDHPIPVTGVIVRRGDEILLVRPHGEELHWLISGYLEAWESVEEAALREVREEVGLEIEIERVVGSYSCRTIGKNLVFVVCLARPIGGELRIGDEITDAQWFPLDALPPWPADSPAAQAVADCFDPLSSPRIRPIVIGVPVRDDQILVIEGYDSVKGQGFFRPAGGGIEFGESADEALRREFAEEFGAELLSAKYLGALENVFTFEARPGHEIVLVYRVELADADRFAADATDGQESDGSPFRAKWLALTDARRGAARLYPDGLLELLEDHGS